MRARPRGRRRRRGHGCGREGRSSLGALLVGGQRATLSRPAHPRRAADRDPVPAPSSTYNPRRTRLKTMKSLTRIALVSALSGAATVLAQDAPLYRDRTRPVDERVRDLLARMTLEEKVAQTLAIWKLKEKVTDEKGQFDPAAARAVLGQGIGQIARPTELRDKPTAIRLGPRENAV